MSDNPINLGVRFLLELAIFCSLSYWGWTQNEGIWSAVWGLALPTGAAALWGTFRVPNDPGSAPVAVPGLVRLLLELGLFAAAVWTLYAAGQPRWAISLGVIVLIHYAVSYDRIGWLLLQK